MCSGVHFFFARRGGSRYAVRHSMHRATSAVFLAFAVALPTLLGAQSSPSTPYAQSARASQPAQAKRPMMFEDVMQMKRLGNTAVSPDGKWLAYSVTTVNLAQK